MRRLFFLSGLAYADTESPATSQLAGGRYVTWSDGVDPLMDLQVVETTDPEGCELRCRMIEECSAYRFIEILTRSEEAVLCELLTIANPPSTPFVSSEILSRFSDFNFTLGQTISNSDLLQSASPSSNAQCGRCIKNSRMRSRNQLCTEPFCWADCACATCGSSFTPRCASGQDRLHVAMDELGFQLERPEPRQDTPGSWLCAGPGYTFMEVETLETLIVQGAAGCHEKCLDHADCVAFTGSSHSVWGIEGPSLCHLHSKVFELVVQPSREGIPFAGFRRCAPFPDVREVIQMASAFNVSHESSSDAVVNMAMDRAWFIIDASGTSANDSTTATPVQDGPEASPEAVPDSDSEVSDQSDSENSDSPSARRLDEVRRLDAPDYIQGWWWWNNWNGRAAGRRLSSNGQLGEVRRLDEVRRLFPVFSEGWWTQWWSDLKKWGEFTQSIDPTKTEFPRRSVTFRRRLSSNGGFASYFASPQQRITIEIDGTKFPKMVVPQDNVDPCSGPHCGRRLQETDEIAPVAEEDADTISDVTTTQAPTTTTAPSTTASGVWYTESDVTGIMAPLMLAASCGRPSEDGSKTMECEVDCYNGYGKLWFEVFYELSGSYRARDIRSGSRFVAGLVLGVCDSTMDTNTETSSAQPSTDFPTSEPLPLDHFSSGMTFKPLNSADIPAAEEGIIELADCHAACMDSAGCEFYTWLGAVCELNNHSIAVDRFSVTPGDAAHLVCENQCNADNECTTFAFKDATCRLYSPEVFDFDLVSNVLYTLDAAIGPVSVDGDPIPEQYRSTFSMVHLPVAAGYPTLAQDLRRQEPQLDGADLTLAEAFDGMEKPSQGCREGFHRIPGTGCVGVSEERLSYRAAQRFCSDFGAHLYSPTTLFEAMELCVLVGGCSDGEEYGLGRGQFWTGISRKRGQWVTEPFGHAFVPAMVDPIIVEPSMYSHLDSGRGLCLAYDASLSSLVGTTCDGYCVAPPSAHSIESNSPECTDLENAPGRLVLARKPALCIYQTESDSQMVKGPYKPSPKLVAVDADTQASNCAALGADIDGGDLFSFNVDSWDACAGSCRDIGQCQSFTFIPPQCMIFKEEIDKGWPTAPVMTLPMEPVEGVSMEDQCERMCLGTPECNIDAEYLAPRCYVKSTPNPDFRWSTNLWLDIVSGPMDCTIPDAYLPPIGHERCPVGYVLGEDQGGELCVGVHFTRKTAIEAARLCKDAGAELASPRDEAEHDMIMNVLCPSPDECVPRGEGTLDGVYYMGLYSLIAGQTDRWYWPGGELLSYPALWGGQDGNAPLLYNGYPTNQPDNTTGNQMCSYIYPRDHGTGYMEVNGNWGDEDCDNKCLIPTSAYQRLTHAPACDSLGMTGGRTVNLERFFICTKKPI